MKDYLCVMMTARGCGHCSNMRGNGIMGSGPHFMKPSVLNEFLSLSNKFSLLNIHYDSMNGKRNLIREISKFSKVKNNIIQEMWSVNEENTNFLRIEVDIKTKKFNQSGAKNIKNNETNILWKDFVKTKVPLKIENYTFYYPCFMVTKTANWLDSINNNSQLYALTNAGKTRKDKSGEVFLDKDGKSFNERMVDPKDMIKDITSGKINISPHIVDTLETNKEEVKTPVLNKRKEKRTNKKPKAKYLIRQY